jgi:malate synthase
VDYASGDAQTWEERVRGHMDLHHFYQGYLMKLNEAGQDERVFAVKAPHVMHRVRSLLDDESNLVIYRHAVPAGLFDVALAAMHNGPFFRQRGHGVDLYLTDLGSVEEARVWADVFAFLAEELGIPAHLFSAHVEVSPDASEEDVLSLLGALGTHAIGIHIAGEGDASTLAKCVQDAGGQVIGPVVDSAADGEALPSFYDGFLTRDMSGLVVAES